MPSHRQDGGTANSGALQFLFNMDREAAVDTDLIDDGPFNNGAHLYNYSGSNAAIIVGPDGRPARSFTAGTNSSNTAVYQAYCAGTAGPVGSTVAMGCRALQTTNPGTNANLLCWLAQDGTPVFILNSTPAGGVYATVRDQAGNFYDTAAVILWPSPNWWNVGAKWEFHNSTLSLLVAPNYGDRFLSVAAQRVLAPGTRLYNNNTNYFQIRSNTALGKVDGIASVWTTYALGRVLPIGFTGEKGIKQKISGAHKAAYKVPRRWFVGEFQKSIAATARGYSITSAVATGMTTVRVTFSVPVVNDTSTNRDGALYPGNYIFYPGLQPIFVTHVSGNQVFDVELGQAMPSVSYQLKVISVQTPDGQEPQSQGGLDTVNFNGYQPLLAINYVSPFQGTDGIDVTINGAGFVLGTTVLFGATPATVTTQLPGTLIVTSPVHALGPVSVTVTNPDLTSVTKPNAFTYVSPIPPVTGLKFISIVQETLFSLVATFNGPVLMGSGNNSYDALNPNNYTITGPEKVTISSVEQVGTSAVRLKFLLPLSPGIYTVSVQNLIAPDGTQLNVPAVLTLNAKLVLGSQGANAGALNSDAAELIRKHLP